MEIEEINSWFNKFTDHRDKDFNELLSELCEHYLEIQGEFGVVEPKEHESNPHDWEDFDIYIKLSHQKIIPPLHSYEVQYSQETYDKICLSYEYFFEYKIELILGKEESFSLIYPYLLSIVLVHYYYSYKEEKKRRLRRIPFIGRMLTRILVGNQHDMTIDDLHKDCKTKLEKYVEGKLDQVDLRNKKKKYDEFFKGTPEEYRGMWIQM